MHFLRNFMTDPRSSFMGRLAMITTLVIMGLLTDPMVAAPEGSAAYGPGAELASLTVGAVTYLVQLMLLLVVRPMCQLKWYLASCFPVSAIPENHSLSLQPSSGLLFLLDTYF